MNDIEIGKDFVDALVEKAPWKLTGSKLFGTEKKDNVLSEEAEEVVEETPVEEKVDEEVKEDEVLCCPLCESKLEEQITDDVFDAHVDKIMEMMVEEGTIQLIEAEESKDEDLVEDADESKEDD